MKILSREKIRFNIKTGVSVGFYFPLVFSNWIRNNANNKPKKRNTQHRVSESLNNLSWETFQLISTFYPLFHCTGYTYSFALRKHITSKRTWVFTEEKLLHNWSSFQNPINYLGQGVIFVFQILLQLQIYNLSENELSTQKLISCLGNFITESDLSVKLNLHPDHSRVINLYVEETILVQSF